MPKLHLLFGLLVTTFDLLLDSLRLIGASPQPRCRLAAENLFLRKQALYLERQVKSHRVKAATRLTLVLLFQGVCLARGSDLGVVNPVAWQNRMDLTSVQRPLFLKRA
jgi:hypothetical protein